LLNKQYFSSVDLRRHAWVDEELVHSAEESVDQLEKELRWHRSLRLLFVSLADFDPSGAYWVGPDMSYLTCYADGSIQWENRSGLILPPKEEALVDFELESRNACNTLHDYLVRLLAYALAHGMDVAKVDREGYGRSILHSLPHSQLHTDVAEYDN
jgi:hypothetical protein